MYLYGASGYAKDIIDILKANGIRLDGLVDDNPAITEVLGVPVYHQVIPGAEYFISIGNNAIRKKIAESLNARFSVALVHPSVVMSPTATIGKGTVVKQGAIVEACCVVGKHCIINTGAVVCHECQIGDYVHVSPHVTLCGNVHVGEGTWIGAGSTVIQGVRIGKNCVIGAGSVVTKDIPDGVLAVGNRCKIIKKVSN